MINSDIGHEGRGSDGAEYDDNAESSYCPAYSSKRESTRADKIGMSIVCGLLMVAPIYAGWNKILPHPKQDYLVDVITNKIYPEEPNISKNIDDYCMNYIKINRRVNTLLNCTPFAITGLATIGIYAYINRKKKNVITV